MMHRTPVALLLVATLCACGPVSDERCVDAGWFEPLVEGSACTPEEDDDRCPSGPSCAESFECFQTHYGEASCLRPRAHPVGAPCSDDSDCAVGRCVGQDVPTCEVPECEVDADCASGVCSHFNCSDARCVAPGELGAGCYSRPSDSCGSSTPCGVGLECRHTDGAILDNLRSGECVVPGNIGAPCTRPYEPPVGVEVDGCAEGLVCGEDQRCSAP